MDCVAFLDRLRCKYTYKFNKLFCFIVCMRSHSMHFLECVLFSILMKLFLLLLLFTLHGYWWPNGQYNIILNISVRWIRYDNIFK